MKMKNEWDDFAKDWDSNTHVIEYSKKAFNSLLEVINIERLNIFDFGCGTGLLSELLIPYAKKIVALDSSSEMTQVLKNKNIADISVIDEPLTHELIQTNALFSNHFDLVVASSVCGFLPDYKQTVKLLKSMLSIGGLFVQWDWLADNDNSDTGLTKHEIESAFKESGMELLSLSVPFSMTTDNKEMRVLMAVGKNV